MGLGRDDGREGEGRDVVYHDDDPPVRFLLQGCYCPGHGLSVRLPAVSNGLNVLGDRQRLAPDLAVGANLFVDGLGDLRVLPQELAGVLASLAQARVPEADESPGLL